MKYIIKEIKDSNEVEKVELYYPKLYITIYGETIPGNSYEPPYAEEFEEKVSFTLLVDKEEIIEDLIEYLWDDEQFENYPRNTLEKYINEHFDELVKKYQTSLKQRYEDRAEEEAEEYYQNKYNDDNYDYDLED